ncbi:MAG: hypothetical protein HWD58_08020 [Bacteroidota bacterium]|nr:MAG: hypothetical protein HWD58_08020 [Bacteroidota bacterium]
MKRLFLIPTLTFIIGFTLYLSTASNSTGITGVSSTGCTCHGNQNFQTTIALSGLPSTGPIAGTTYSLKLKVTNAVKIQAGFNLSVNQEIFQTTVRELKSQTEDQNSIIR